LRMIYKLMSPFSVIHSDGKLQNMNISMALIKKLMTTHLKTVCEKS
jgi:hypothetical protein